MNQEPNKDFAEQYMLLAEEEEKEKRRRLILIIIFILILILLLAFGGTYAYYKKHHHGHDIKTCKINCDLDKDGKCDINCDIDNDDKAEINIDKDSDGTPDINIDTNSDNKPDLNVDYFGNENAHFNIDTNNDDKADFNLMNQDTNNDGICDINCDTNSDGWPEINIDIDGDGNVDLNVDTNNDKKADVNIDTDKDGKCDLSCTAPSGDENDTQDDLTDGPLLDVETEDNITLYLGTIKNIQAKDIIPGWKDTLVFTVTNNSDYNVYFKLNWSDVANTITEVNNITYTLSKDNVLIIPESKAPYQNSELLSKTLITPNTTYKYTMKFEFKETGVDQSVDQNKVFKGGIKAEVVK